MRARGEDLPQSFPILGVPPVTHFGEIETLPRESPEGRGWSFCDVGETSQQGKVVAMQKNDAKEPRIYCDLNGRMTEHRYLPTRGTTDDLAALGLTLEHAVGRRFMLAMPDADEHDNPGVLVARGTVVIDQEGGFLLQANEEFTWQSEPDGK